MTGTHLALVKGGDCPAMLYDPTRRWINQGACRREDPGLFLAELNTGRTPNEAVLAKWEQAKGVCARCPVLEKCRRDTLGEPYGVWGGHDPNERRIKRSNLPKVVPTWPQPLRLAWGKELHTLVEGGVQWGRIRQMTGFASPLGERLIKEWREHLRSASKPAPVAAPLPERALKPFPVKPGKKNCWVRDGAIMRDAYYRAQTSDGVWIRVQFRSSREATFKWIRATNVYQYHPQPVVIQPYLRRPDAQKGSQSA